MSSEYSFWSNILTHGLQHAAEVDQNTFIMSPWIEWRSSKAFSTRPVIRPLIITDKTLWCDIHSLATQQFLVMVIEREKI